MFCSSVPAHGLGPVALANKARCKGASCFNKTAEPGATSRALGGPSCEHSNSTYSLTSPITVVARGRKVPAVNLWVKGEPATRLCDLTWGGA
jgi:hypothetical protein